MENFQFPVTQPEVPKPGWPQPPANPGTADILMKFHQFSLEQEQRKEDNLRKVADTLLNLAEKHNESQSRFAVASATLDLKQTLMDQMNAYRQQSEFVPPELYNPVAKNYSEKTGTPFTPSTSPRPRQDFEAMIRAMGQVSTRQSKSLPGEAAAMASMRSYQKVKNVLAITDRNLDIIKNEGKKSGLSPNQSVYAAFTVSELGDGAVATLGKQMFAQVSPEAKRAADQSLSYATTVEPRIIEELGARQAAIMMKMGARAFSSKGDNYDSSKLKIADAISLVNQQIDNLHVQYPNMRSQNFKPFIPPNPETKKGLTENQMQSLMRSLEK